jgi:hypothetical protein
MENGQRATTDNRQPTTGSTGQPAKPRGNRQPAKPATGNGQQRDGTMECADTATSDMAHLLIVLLASIEAIFVESYNN